MAMAAAHTRLPAIDVAVAIVQDTAGRILLAERKPAQLSPGFWELPGGKIERGETPQQAAVRELEEEVGVRATSLRPWASYTHAFPTRHINLRFFRADSWDGTPHGREGQRIAWVDPAAPSVAPLLASHDRVLQQLALPRRIALACGETIPYQNQLLSAIGQAAGSGIRLIILCPPPLSPDQRVALARRAQAIAAANGARLVLQASALDAQRASAAGAISNATALRTLSARPALRLWGAMCQSAEDLRHASALGADFVLLGSALSGLPLRDLATRAPMPVFAMGGAPDAGAYGIAVTLN